MPRQKKAEDSAVVFHDRISKKGNHKKTEPPENPAPTTPPPQTDKTPEPPDWLASEAIKVWNRELPLLDLHPGKLQLFAAYCSHSGRAIEFEREINKNGKGTRMSNRVFKKAAEISAAQKEWKAASDLATKLGITALVKEKPPGGGEAPPPSGQPVTSSKDQWDSYYEGGPKPGNR